MMIEIGEFRQMPENRAPMDIWHWTIADDYNTLGTGVVLKLDEEELEDVFRHICFLAKLNRDDFGEVLIGETCGGDFWAEPKVPGNASVYFGWNENEYEVVKQDLMNYFMNTDRSYEP